MIPIDKISSGDRLRQDPGDVKELAKSIESVGQIEPIIVMQNDFGNSKSYTLLSGLRRLEAFKLLGRKEIYAIIFPEGDAEQLDTLKRPLFGNTDMPLQYQVELESNIRRKDYTESEIASLQRWYKAIFEQRKQQGYRTDLKGPRQTSSNIMEQVNDRHGVYGWIAKIFGGKESHNHIWKRLDFFDAAARHPEQYSNVVRQLEEGRISLSRAHREKEKIEQRIRVLESPDPEQVPSADNLRLLNKDFQKCQDDIQDNSVDLVFVDPPYGDEHIELYSDLGRIAMQKLKEGSCLVTYLGHRNLSRVIRRLEGAGLTYHWIFDIRLNGPEGRDHERRINIHHKPLLCFTKGDKRLPRKYVMDFVDKSKMPKKALHPWQQDTEEARYYIDKLTPKHGLVVDFMMGSGTTGVAAIELGRRFVGIETNSKTFEIARKRIITAAAEQNN